MCFRASRCARRHPSGRADARVARTTKTLSTLERAGGGEMWEKCRKGVARRLAAMRTRDERLP